MKITVNFLNEFWIFHRLNNFAAISQLIRHLNVSMLSKEVEFVEFLFLPSNLLPPDKNLATFCLCTYTFGAHANRLAPSCMGIPVRFTAAAEYFNHWSISTTPAKQKRPLRVPREISTSRYSSLWTRIIASPIPFTNHSLNLSCFRFNLSYFVSVVHNSADIQRQRILQFF